MSDPINIHDRFNLYDDIDSMGSISHDHGDNTSMPKKNTKDSSEKNTKDSIDFFLGIGSSINTFRLRIKNTHNSSLI